MPQKYAVGDRFSMKPLLMLVPKSSLHTEFYSEIMLKFQGFSIVDFVGASHKDTVYNRNYSLNIVLFSPNGKVLGTGHTHGGKSPHTTPRSSHTGEL